MNTNRSLWSDLPMSVAGLDLDSSAHVRRVLALATGCQARLRRQGNQTSPELKCLCKRLKRTLCAQRNLERRGNDL